MMETQVLYIGIGLIVSLLYVAIFGVTPGGIIVPGYLALSIDDPVMVALTLGISLLIFFAVRVPATVMIIYGRRRTVLRILIGFLLGSPVHAGLGAGTSGAGAADHRSMIRKAPKLFARVSSMPSTSVRTPSWERRLPEAIR
jgi:poly-gamma-glutamate biosynthesis protein PgsC/CapC